LRELAQRGIRVPALARAEAQTLWLSDLGPTLADRLSQATQAVERQALVTGVVAALAECHARGGYLGQAFARNITVTDAGVVGFLDVEEDPCAAMDLPHAQARDWLHLALDLARHLKTSPEWDAWERGVFQCSAPVRAVLTQTAHRLRGLLRWAPHTAVARARVRLERFARP
jgi:hypothetical protein